MPMSSYDARSRYQQQMDRLRLSLTTGPATEPITKTQCKAQLSIASDDTTHDDQLDLLIQVARETVEGDTGLALIAQTWTQHFPLLQDGLKLSRQPVSSITSISYYDIENANQTLSTSYYALDATTREIRLKPDQTWPSTYERFDAVSVVFVAGYASATVVPAVAKQAMLLLVAHLFENRDGIIAPNMRNMAAYEHLIAKLQRSDYP